MNKFNLKLIILLLMCSTQAESILAGTKHKASGTYGDMLARVPSEISEALTDHLRPNKNGAMGRNRSNYFHVRFQMGMHNFAIGGLAQQSSDQIEHYFRALHYAFQYQNTDGSFILSTPKAIKRIKTVTKRDKVAGHSFFLATASSGLLALSTSSWLRNRGYAEARADQIAIIKSGLAPSLHWLISRAVLLKKSDIDAPNRLIINAAALILSGILLDNKEAITLGYDFIALAQVHIHEEGYFIEGGGYDSSYNGVATAWMFKLAMATRDEKLLLQAFAALRWQVQRIEKSGKVSTAGNSRVKQKGERFLGRKKDVDLVHTLEALSYGHALSGDKTYRSLARKVLDHYKH